MKLSLKLKPILTLFITLTFISCGGSTTSNDTNQTDQNNTTPIQKGTVYDDLLINLHYQTKDFNSTTDNNGQFNYKEGEVKFYLGDMFIGQIDTMTKDNKVFLSDILNLKRGDYSNPKLVKLARLLQSLDTTSKDNNKIVLDIDKIKQLFHETNQTIQTLNLETLNITLVSKEEAKQRVKKTYQQEQVDPIDIQIKIEVDNKTQGEPITLDGSKSIHNDGTIEKYEWFNKDTLLHVGKTFNTNSLSAGTYTITLKVTDNKGATSSTTTTITIEEPTPQPTPTPDTTKPTITSTTPENNATNIKIDSNITITFSESIKDANTSTIKLEDNASTPNEINGTITPSSGTTITFNPNANLSYNTTYTLTITTGIKDSAGNALASNVTRSFKTLVARFERNATSQTVYDHITGRMWQDDGNASSVEKTWNYARYYCDNLTFAGHSDWRLSSRDELLSIVDGSRSAPKIDEAFANCASGYGYYWSSTVNRPGSNAWYVRFDSGNSYFDSNSIHHNVRCVR